MMPPIHITAPSWVSEFKAFILRGNVVDLAVGIIIGAAFTTIVNSLVKDIYNPLMGCWCARSRPGKVSANRTVWE